MKCGKTNGATRGKWGNSAGRAERRLRTSLGSLAPRLTLLLAAMAALLFFAGPVLGEQRFPPPDFESGHKLHHLLISLGSVVASPMSSFILACWPG